MLYSRTRINRVVRSVVTSSVAYVMHNRALCKGNITGMMSRETSRCEGEEA
jgi:hypothetical protein